MAGNGPVSALRAARLAVAVTASVVAGCGTSATPGADASIAATYDQKTGRLERLAYDRNGDGKPDAWVFMDGTRVVRAELDENHDGIVDRWEHFEPPAPGAPGAGAKPPLARVEVAAGPDGVVSRREYYEDDELVRAEDDSDGDGRTDKWETWSAGALAAVALDTNGDGTPDRRIVYPADGSPARFETEAQ